MWSHRVLLQMGCVVVVQGLERQHKFGSGWSGTRTAGLILCWATVLHKVLLLERRVISAPSSSGKAGTYRHGWEVWRSILPEMPSLVSLYLSLQALKDLAIFSAFYAQFMPALLLTLTLAGVWWGLSRSSARVLFILYYLCILCLILWNTPWLFWGWFLFSLFYVPKINLINMDSILH